MKPSSLRLRTLIVLTATAAALAACGGDDDDDNNAAAPPPAPAPAANDLPGSATQSTAGLLAYLNQLIDQSSNDTSEPVQLGDATLPTDDTAEPAPVN